MMLGPTIFGRERKDRCVPVAIRHDNRVVIDEIDAVRTFQISRNNFDGTSKSYAL